MQARVFRFPEPFGKRKLPIDTVVSVRHTRRVPVYGAYAKHPAGPAAEELGRLLRNARNSIGLSQKAVCDEAGTSVTTLSMLESGQRAVSPALLERIVAVVGADTVAVFRLAGAVPPGAVREVLDPQLGNVLLGDHLDPDRRWQLRKLHLAELAEQVTSGVTEPPVDMHELLDRRFARDCQQVAGISWPRFGPLVIEHPAKLSREELQRQLAHMAAHAVLAQEADRAPFCHALSAGTDDERDAEWLGGLIAMPRVLLRSSFEEAALRWGTEMPDGLQKAVADVASHFAVPFWLAMRHIADSDLLEWGYGQSV